MCRNQLSLPAVLAVVVVLPFINGCSTPKHTNTLIFGTNTKFALDVSQDPTGATGVTIGYKRQEAVWMPLLANEGEKLDAAKCADDKCKQFQGTVGSGGSAGEGAVDTYSVLATFSGQAGGGTAQSGIQATGSLAQYFATGFAARLLAANGGAALVNTNVKENVSPEGISAATHADNSSLIQDQKKKIEKIMAAVTNKNDVLNHEKLNALVRNAQAKISDPGAIAVLRDASNDANTIRDFITPRFDTIGAPLFEALP